ncbi:MAG: ABC transporter permease [Bryobacteraceae bacterium]
MTLWNKLRAYFSKSELDREFDEEARTHLALATEDFIRRGYSGEEAQRLAKVKFGSIEASKDEHRDSRGIAWLDGLAHDFRFSVRSLVRDRMFSITAIVMLALALGLNVTAFAVMDTMLFRGLPLAKDSSRLVFIQERRTLNGCCLFYADFLAWRERAKSFVGLAYVGGKQVSLSEGDAGSRDTDATTVSANTFGLLGVRPLLGRDFLPSDEVPGAAQVVILNYRTWQERFGRRSDIIGRVLRVNQLPATVIGVTPEGFDFPDRGVLWMPLQPTTVMMERKPAGYLVVGRLADGATAAGAGAEIDTINRQLEADFPATNKGVRARVDAYAEFFIGPEAKAIYGSLWVAAWVVLIIACANLANLTLARTVGRSREFSTRLALGASQGRMIRQIFMESALLASVGSVLAWFIAGWAVQRWAAATATRYVVLDYAVDSGRLEYLMLITIGAALLYGLIPAVRSVRLDVNGVLKGDARGATISREARRIAGVLVAGQMALAVILLVGAGVLARSLWNIVGADTGVSGADKVLVGQVSLPREGLTADARSAFWSRLRAELLAIPGVESESLANAVPLGNPGSLPFELDGGDQPSTAQKPRATLVSAGSGYLHTVGASILAGREFTDADDRSVAMVNQSFANQYWPGLDPIGRRVGFRRGEATAWRTVVGVASNIMQDRPLRDRFVPIVYAPILPQSPSAAAVLVRTHGSAVQVAAQVRKVIERSDPSVSLADYSTLQASLAFDRDRMDLEHAELGKHAAVAPIFAGISLLLAAIGLYAVVANSVRQRTKEIGLRMVLGAEARDVRRLVFREGMRPVGVGLVLGLGASLGLNRVLESQLVGVSPYDAVTFAAAPLLLITVALLGCQLPAQRAIRVDPATVLRHD